MRNLIFLALLISSPAMAQNYGSYGSVPTVVSGQDTYAYQRQKPQSYNPPTYNGYNQGARGYNGATGRADTNYVPVNPNLTPGLTPYGYAKQ